MKTFSYYDKNSFYDFFMLSIFSNTKFPTAKYKFTKFNFFTNKGMFTSLKKLYLVIIFF